MSYDMISFSFNILMLSLCYLQRNCDLSGPCSDGEGILSPLDEDSFADSEHTVISPIVPATNDYVSNITMDNDVEGD